MFDTSVVRTHAISGPRGATLLVSMFLHSLAGVAVLSSTAISVELPAQPPKQFALYRPERFPVAPPPPGSRPQSNHVSLPARPTRELTPVPVPPAPGAALSGAQLSAGSGLLPGAAGGSDREGSPEGVPDGSGVAGLDGMGQVTSGPYSPGSGVTSARVLSRVEPRFPLAYRHAVREAVVVVRCVIGREGNVRDPQIISSSFAPLNDAVLTALRQWTFAPGMMGGQPVDSWFELSVRFQVR